MLQNRGLSRRTGREGPLYPEINPLKPSREHDEPLPEGDQRREAGEGSGGELAPPCSRRVILLTWLTKADVEYGFCRKMVPGLISSGPGRHFPEPMMTATSQ